MLGIGLGMLVDLEVYRPVVTGEKSNLEVTIISAGRAHSNPPLSGSSIPRDEYCETANQIGSHRP